MQYHTGYLTQKFTVFATFQYKLEQRNIKNILNQQSRINNARDQISSKFLPVLSKRPMCHRPGDTLDKYRGGVIFGKHTKIFGNFDIAANLDR